MDPKSVLRKLQKMARQRVLERDSGTCVVCGSKERVEAAHIVQPPINYFLSYTYETDEQLEKEARKYYWDENIVLLCRKCHMTCDYPYLLQEFATDVGREKAAELVMKALIDAGVELGDLKSGAHERVIDCVMNHMTALYGSRYDKFLKRLNGDREALLLLFFNSFLQ